MLQMKLYCTPLPLHMWPKIYLNACQGAGARGLTFALAPDSADKAPLHGVPRTVGDPCPKHFTAGPPTSLAALTVPLGKPSHMFLPSCFKDLSLMSPGCTYCGSQYSWTTHVCSVLFGEARQGKKKKKILYCLISL